jgi:hypothetical protein
MQTQLVGWFTKRRQKSEFRYAPIKSADSDEWEAFWGAYLKCRQRWQGGSPTGVRKANPDTPQ